MAKSTPNKNVFWQDTRVTPENRANSLNQKPLCIWFTGISGSGKTTLANLLEEALQKEGIHTMLLDGDNVRHGLCSDLGFSHEDRTENLRRVAHVSHLMVEAGLVVIAAFISPSKIQRDYARSLFEKEQFIEVFIDAPVNICIERDPKGLYKLANSGAIKHMTGLDQNYENPLNPELHIDTNQLNINECILSLLTIFDGKK